MCARERKRIAADFDRAAGHDHDADAGIPGASDHGIAIGIEGVVSEVGADVDERHGCEA
jgi:hypothetical protein